MPDTEDYIVFDRTGTPHVVVAVKTEIGGDCPYDMKLQRMPKSYPGGLGLCPKLATEKPPEDKPAPCIKRISIDALRAHFDHWMEDEDSAPLKRWIAEDIETGRVEAVDNRNGCWTQNTFQDEYTAVLWLLGKDPDGEYFDYTGLVEETEETRNG